MTLRKIALPHSADWDVCSDISEGKIDLAEYISQSQIEWAHYLDQQEAASKTFHAELRLLEKFFEKLNTGTQTEKTKEATQ
jgi:hypothetical protein